MPARASLLACLFLSAAALGAQDLSGGYFVAQFWCELNPMVQVPGTVYPLSKEAAVRQILSEARFAFSGMIYGFDFDYTPPDAARGVGEVFTLKPVAEIPWSDPRLRVLDTRVEDGRLIARIVYTLAPFQESWVQGWDSEVYPDWSATGSGSFYRGFSEKLASYRDAIKEAIRGYLRSRVYNKPREVRGEAVLRGAPSTIMSAGKYLTTVTVRFRIERLVPYAVF